MSQCFLGWSVDINYIYDRKMGGCKIRLGSQTIPYKSISNAANELCGISLSKDAGTGV